MNTSHLCRRRCRRSLCFLDTAPNERRSQWKEMGMKERRGRASKLKPRSPEISCFFFFVPRVNQPCCTRGLWGSCLCQSLKMFLRCTYVWSQINRVGGRGGGTKTGAAGCYGFRHTMSSLRQTEVNYNQVSKSFTVFTRLSMCVFL